MKDKKNWFIIALGVVIFALLYRGCEKDDQLEKQTALYTAVNDSLETKRNKLGQQEAEIALLVGTHESDLLKIQTQDETIKKLQGTVEKYKGKLAAALVGATSTSESGTTATEIIHDTVRIGGKEYVYPVYKSSWDEEWSKGSIVASKDSIKRDIFVRNEFEITQGWKKEKWYKKKTPVVNIKNLNPNTETEELRSFVVEQDKKRIGVGLGAMYGIDLVGLKPTIVIGVGVQWTLMRF